MANDYGIKISAPGYDATDATNLQLLLNMDYPIAKLDTTNVVSFQDILLTFVTDPTEPPLDSNNTTLVYSFNHGYSYTPQTWTLFNVLIPPPSRSILEAYNQENILLGQVTLPGVDSVNMKVFTDATTVYFYVDKYRSSLPGNGPTNIAGCQVKIRVYVFVQDITS